MAGRKGGSVLLQGRGAEVGSSTGKQGRTHLPSPWGWGWGHLSPPGERGWTVPA